MAEEAFVKAKEQLNCSICLDTYTDPKLLQCFHVYCQQCLEKLVVRDQQGQLGLTCPTCRQVTPIPDRGVAGLQSAFHINRLLVIQKSATTAATPAGVHPIKKVGHCSAHESKELELYCETCGELICWKCIARGGEHRDHDYEELDQIFEQYKEEVISSLEPMENQVTIIKKALAQLNDRCREISDQQVAIKESIRFTFRRHREILSVREIKLVNQLDQISQGKLKGLAAQRDQMETTLSRLSSCLHFVRENLKTGNEGGVLLMKTNTVKQVEELTTPLQPDFLKPNAKADIEFRTSQDLTAVCQNYGQVFAPGLPDPSKCHITVQDAEVATVGETSTVTLHAVNFEGKPCEESIKSLEFDLVSMITGTRACCSVVRRGQSQYKISYQPTIKGRHQLHIRAEGEHIRGSPFRTTVKSPDKKLGTPILTIDRVWSPWGVAINQSGEVVVTEEAVCCVSIFSLMGKEIQSFGTLGSNQGQFRNPRGVAVDRNSNILIADSWNHRIQKFTAKGQFISAMGTKGSGPLQFCNPSDIAFNCSNKMVYVADESNHRVQVLNSDLTFSSAFGMEGSGMGQFSSPHGIACDSTGKVYVADTNNHRIQVFTAEGKFLRTFGRCGHGSGELARPVGIAIDANNMVYVSEHDNHRISVFSSRDQFVTSFGRKGKGLGEFRSPYGLVVDSSGIIYVCDQNTDRVQMFN